MCLVRERARWLVLAVANVLLALAWGTSVASPPRACAQSLVLGAPEGTRVERSVVLLREGQSTVLSIAHTLAVPTGGELDEDVVIVMAVPASVRADDVHTLEGELFARLERSTAPRLVEHWEEDPCPGPTTPRPESRYVAVEDRGRSAYGGGPPARTPLEARVARGAYEITVLDAESSSAVEAWLAAHGTEAPTGADAALRPYVTAGMRVLVARVATEHGHLEGGGTERGRITLAPLRVRFDAPELSLPLTLAPIGATPDELVVIVLARQQRYEARSHPNVFVSTNVDVTRDVQRDFAGFYGALVSRTFERHPGATLTEHAWPATSCDPCPEDALLDAAAITSLGGDVLYPEGVQAIAARAEGSEMPTVRLEPASAEGITPELAHRVVRRHVNELRFCYEQVLGVDPTATGTLDAEVELMPTGAVQRATLTPRAGSSLPRVVLGCATQAFRRWTFPAQDGARFRVAVTLGSGIARASTGPVTVATASDFVATRLRLRSTSDPRLTDLVLVPAEPVVGGREIDDGGRLEAGATPSWEHGFQARYAVRHPWQGAIACETPERGRWQGLPLGADPRRPLQLHASVATSIGTELPPDVALESLIVSPIEDLGLAGSEVRDATDDVTPIEAHADGTAEAHAESPSRATPSGAAHGAAPSAGGACHVATRAASPSSSFSLLAVALALARSRLRRL